MLCSRCTLFRSALFLKYTSEKTFAIFFLRQVTLPFLQEAVVGCMYSQVPHHFLPTKFEDILGKVASVANTEQFVVIPQTVWGSDF